MTSFKKNNSSFATLKNKDLLVIAHRYNTFTKEQIDELANFFDNITVLVRYNRITDISSIFPHPTLKRLGTETKIVDESPDNVTVITTPLLYIPTDSWLQYLGRQHYRRVMKTLERHSIKFDLIHAHFTWTSGYVASRIKEEYNVPYIVTVHENENRLTDEIESENKDIYQAWEDADAIIRVNKKDCKRLEFFNEDVHHIPNGFSRSRFPTFSKLEARERLGIDENLDLIFSLGSLIPRKQFDILIDAVGRLDNRENLYCAIGGHGKLKDVLQQRIKTQDLGNRIDLLGYLTEEELVYWMNACDIFSLTSRAEGNPTVMFEALGCGRPYVGTNVGGVDEIITSNDYGLICEESNAISVGEILNQSLNMYWNEDQILSYASNFTWHNISKRIAAICLNIL